MIEPSSPTRPVPTNFAQLSMELRPFFGFARRWWMLAMIMTLFSSALTLAMVLVRGLEYQVNAALIYKLGPELAPPPTMVKDPIVITRRAEDVNDEIEILTSPDLVHEVIAELGEDFFRAPPATTTFGKLKQVAKDAMNYCTSSIEEMMIQMGLRRRLTLLQKIELGTLKKLNVELVRESDVIAVSLNTPAPEAGVVILEKLLEAYQKRHAQIHQEMAVKDFLGDKKETLREKLLASSSEMLNFQTSADLWSPDDQQKQLLEQRKSLTLQVAASNGRVSHLTSMVAGLTSSIEQLDDVIELSKTEQMNPVIVNLEDRVASLNQALAVVETSYQASSRTADDRREQIASLRQRIQAEPKLVLHTTTTGVNAVRQDLVKELALRHAELEGTREQLEIENRQLADIGQALQRLGASIATYQHMQREHLLLEQKYSLYSDNYEKSDIAAVMNLAQISNVEMISPPTASLEPVSPRLSMVAAAGIISGLMLAFCVAILFELRTAARARAA